MGLNWQRGGLSNSRHNDRAGLFNQFVRIMEPAALDLRVHTLHQLRLMDFKVLRLTESRESMYS